MPLPGKINSFSANVYLILKGQTVTVSWSTSNSVAPSLNGASVPPSGSKNYTLQATTTFTLKAFSEAGGDTQSLTVRIIGDTTPTPPPSPAYYRLTIYTDPGACTVNVSDVGTFTSAVSSSITIGNISAGYHVLTVSKEGYTTYTETLNFTGNVTRTVPLKRAPVICKAGDVKCIGLDLYECNPSGTEWLLKEKNSKICALQSAEPDFLKDPLGWIVWAIVSSFEAITGFLVSGFKVLMQNVNNFMVNFSLQLVEFIKDPVSKLHGWLDGVFVAAGDFLKGVQDGIGKWYDDNLKGTVDAIGETLNGVKDWIGSGWDSLTAWWGAQMILLEFIWDNKMELFQLIMDESIFNINLDVDFKIVKTREWIEEQQRKGKEATLEREDLIVTLLQEWFMEQITNYFNDALNGLNEEFDTMKKEEEEKKEPWRKTP